MDLGGVEGFEEYLPTVRGGLSSGTHYYSERINSHKLLSTDRV